MCMIIEAHEVLRNFKFFVQDVLNLDIFDQEKNMLMLYLHVFCDSMFSLEIFSTHLTLICFKCHLHMKKHL
jgi:hypothetical protein